MFVVSVGPAVSTCGFNSYFAVQVIYSDGDVEILLLKKERWEFVKDDSNIDVVSHDFCIFFYRFVLMLIYADLICRIKPKTLLILMFLQKSKFFFLVEHYMDLTPFCLHGSYIFILIRYSLDPSES